MPLDLVAAQDLDFLAVVRHKKTNMPCPADASRRLVLWNTTISPFVGDEVSVPTLLKTPRACACGGRSTVYPLKAPIEKRGAPGGDVAFRVSPCRLEETHDHRIPSFGPAHDVRLGFCSIVAVRYACSERASRSFSRVPYLPWPPDLQVFS